jgi:hypothetical protein
LHVPFLVVFTVYYSLRQSLASGFSRSHPRTRPSCPLDISTPGPSAVCIVEVPARPKIHQSLGAFRNRHRNGCNGTRNINRCPPGLQQDTGKINRGRIAKFATLSSIPAPTAESIGTFKCKEVALKTTFRLTRGCEVRRCGDAEI